MKVLSVNVFFAHSFAKKQIYLIIWPLCASRPTGQIENPDISLFLRSIIESFTYFFILPHILLQPFPITICGNWRYLNVWKKRLIKNDENRHLLSFPFFVRDYWQLCTFTNRFCISRQFHKKITHLLRRTKWSRSQH